MPLFPNINPTEKYKGNVGKTHTNLVISGGDAPAEKLIVSKTNEFESFLYEFGPEGNQLVVMPKGKIVEAAGVEYDRETGHEFTAVKVAAEESEAVLGLNQHNIYETGRDEMTVNGPNVITRNLVEVPLFEAPVIEQAAAAAKAMKFGAAYGVSGDLTVGDYVVTGVDGNFKKFDKEKHTTQMIVGQVWGATRELPPMGFLQYYMDIENKDMKDFLKQVSNPGTPGGDGYPYGAPYTVKGWEKDFLKQLGAVKPTGIPFLTDGFFRAQKRISVTLAAADENLESVRVNDVSTINKETGAITVKEDKDNEGFVYVKVKHKLNPRKLDGVEVTYKDAKGAVVKLSPKDIKVIPDANVVALYLPAGSFTDVTVAVDAVVNPIAGLPTEWDYAGSTGAVRILLQK